MSFSALPVELVLNICEYTTQIDLVSLSSTSNKLRNVLRPKTFETIHVIFDIDGLDYLNESTNPWSAITESRTRTTKDENQEADAAQIAPPTRDKKRWTSRLSISAGLRRVRRGSVQGLEARSEETAVEPAVTTPTKVENEEKNKPTLTLGPKTRRLQKMLRGDRNTNGGRETLFAYAKKLVIRLTGESAWFKVPVPFMRELEDFNDFSQHMVRPLLVTMPQLQHVETNIFYAINSFAPKIKPILEPLFTALATLTNLSTFEVELRGSRAGILSSKAIYSLSNVTAFKLHSRMEETVLDRQASLVGVVTAIEEHITGMICRSPHLEELAVSDDEISFDRIVQGVPTHGDGQLSLRRLHVINWQNTTPREDATLSRLLDVYEVDLGSVHYNHIPVEFVNLCDGMARVGLCPAVAKINTVYLHDSILQWLCGTAQNPAGDRRLRELAMSVGLPMDAPLHERHMEIWASTFWTDVFPAISPYLERLTLVPIASYEASVIYSTRQQRAYYPVGQWGEGTWDLERLRVWDVTTMLDANRATRLLMPHLKHAELITFYNKDTGIFSVADSFVARCPRMKVLTLRVIDLGGTSKALHEADGNFRVVQPQELDGHSGLDLRDGVILRIRMTLPGFWGSRAPSEFEGIGQFYCTFVSRGGRWSLLRPGGFYSPEYLDHILEADSRRNQSRKGWKGSKQ